MVMNDDSGDTIMAKVKGCVQKREMEFRVIQETLCLLFFEFEREIDFHGFTGLGLNHYGP